MSTHAFGANAPLENLTQLANLYKLVETQTDIDHDLKASSRVSTADSATFAWRETAMMQDAGRLGFLQSSVHGGLSSKK